MADSIQDDSRRGCLEPELIAAYLDAGVGELERATVERHVTVCNICGELLVESARLIINRDDPRLARLESLCQRRTQT